VESWAWPLFEVENGVFRLTVKPKQIPLKDYFSMQGRFKQLSEEQLKEMQTYVDKKRKILLELDGKQIIY
jgi:pyruvate/2-oxoacid:ferredoxin oxidoreductase beta subunit